MDCVKTFTANGVQLSLHFDFSAILDLSRAGLPLRAINAGLRAVDVHVIAQVLRAGLIGGARARQLPPAPPTDAEIASIVMSVGVFELVGVLDEALAMTLVPTKEGGAAPEGKATPTT